MKVETLVHLKLKTLSLNGDSLKKEIFAKVGLAVQKAAPKITVLMIDRISTEAKSKLRTTADEYIRLLQDPENIKVTESSVTLDPIAPLIVALENGYDVFDIKAEALRHATKFSKEGDPYKDIVFTHLAGSIPESIKSVLQQQTSKERKSGVENPRVRFEGELPGSSYKKTMHFGGRSLEVLGSNKTGIFSGVYRKSTAKKATYSTVRRISKESAPSSWYHPGFQGVHIFQSLRGMIEKEARQILIDALHKQGIPTK